MDQLTRLDKIRNYFCTNQRKLHRRFVRYIAVAIFGLSMLTNVFHYLSWNDRREMKQKAELSRQMLDARARIQIITIRASWNNFTEAERKFIQDNYDIAEYDSAAPIKE